LKDVIGEVLAFGILNAAVVAPFLALWNPAGPTITAYLAFVLGLEVGAICGKIRSYGSARAGAQ
jgi:hypothetical protein